MSNDDIKNPASTRETTSEFSWNTHSYLNEYIRFADAKAFGVIVFSCTILGALISAGLSRYLHAVSASCSPEWFLTIGICCSWTSVLTLVASLGFSIAVIWPRLNPKSPKHSIFWEGILQHCSSLEYAKNVSEKTDDQLRREVLEHNYHLSVIAARKYYSTTLAIYSASVGFVTATFTLLFFV